jgi:hypothetical protein
MSASADGLELVFGQFDLRALSPDFPFGAELEVFDRREDVERFIEEVRGDDPDLASYLRIEERELKASGLRPQRGCHAGSDPAVETTLIVSPVGPKIVIPLLVSATNLLPFGDQDGLELAYDVSGVTQRTSEPSTFAEKTSA